MSPVPDVLEMARKAPGYDEDGIDPEVVAPADEAGGERLGGSGDSAEAVVVQREVGFSGSGAGLDLDERYHAAFAGDEIDLADRRPGAAGEDPPALHLEPERREAFGAPAAALGPLPLHLSASARS